MPDDLKSWFPLYVADILTSRMIRGFEAEQFGIFMFLLIEQWDGGPLPEDKSDLCGMARCKSWPKVEAILQRGFVLHDRGWVNERLVEIWEEQTAKIRRKSQAGKLGAEARWGKRTKLLSPPEAPVDIEENGNRIQPAIDREDATAMPPQCDTYGKESRGEESIREKKKETASLKKKPTKTTKPESEKSKKPEVRRRFRDDTIYILEGLAYPGQGSKTPTIVRGYNEVPIQDFRDMAVSLGEEPVLPDFLVIETQEQLTAFLEAN